MARDVGGRESARQEHRKLLGVGHPHNAAIQIWAELGVVGAVLTVVDRPADPPASRPSAASGRGRVAGAARRRGARWRWSDMAPGRAGGRRRSGPPSSGCSPLRQTAERETHPMSEFDVDLFVIGAGSGGVRAARDRGRLRRAGHGGGGIPRRRHLRDPRLRAEEAAGLCQPLRRRFPGCGGLRLDVSASRASTGRP